MVRKLAIQRKICISRIARLITKYSTKTWIKGPWQAWFKQAQASHEVVKTIKIDSSIYLENIIEEKRVKVAIIFQKLLVTYTNKARVNGQNQNHLREKESQKLVNRRKNIWLL